MGLDVAEASTADSADIPFRILLLPAFGHDFA